MYLFVYIILYKFIDGENNSKYNSCSFLNILFGNSLLEKILWTIKIMINNLGRNFYECVFKVKSKKSCDLLVIKIDAEVKWNGTYKKNVTI